MISINQCREILGKSGAEISDQKAEHLRDTLVVLVDFAIDSYLEKRRQAVDRQKYENE